MCEKAGEIYTGYKLGMGDFYWSKRREEVLVVGQSCMQYRGLKHYTWLPRQDQLQAMVEGINEDNLHRLFRFNRFIEEHDYLPITHQCPYIYFINLVDRDNIEEILWLAFVMHEKYQKQWSEEKGDWISV